MAGPYDYWMGDIALRGGDIWEKSLRQQQDLQRGNIMPQDMPQYQAFKSMWEKMQQTGMNNMLRQASLIGLLYSQVTPLCFTPPAMVLVVSAMLG